MRARPLQEVRREREERDGWTYGGGGEFARLHDGGWTGYETGPPRYLFPSPEAVRKVLYLAITKASEHWSRPIKDWRAALNHFAIVFGDRVPS